MNFPDFMKIALVVFSTVGLFAMCIAATAKEPVTCPNVTYPSKPSDHIDLPSMMAAIVAVENTPRYLPGRNGERSEFQLTEAVWRQHSRMPFSWASSNKPHCIQETQRVVRAHLKWIFRCLHSDGQVITPYSVGAIYKVGWKHFCEFQLTPEDQEYAYRIATVYQEELQKDKNL